MMRQLFSRKKTFKYVVIAVVLGCSTTVSAAHLGAVQQGLNTQRQQWRLLEADEYVFRFERICFCPLEFVSPGLVHVVDGDIESVRHAVTDEVLDSMFFLTVNELFDQVQSAIDSHADEMLVEYDGPLGHPTSIDIDFIELAIDDELSFRARDLRVVPEPQSVVLMILGLVLLIHWHSHREFNER